MTLDYHIIAVQAPLVKGDDGMFHVVIPDVPEHLEMHIAEASTNEYGGFVTIVFTESKVHVDDDEKPVSKLSVVEPPKLIVP